MGRKAPEYLPREYGLTQEYLSLRIWERLKISPAEQDELSPGDKATLIEFEIIRQHEEARLRFGGL